MEKKYQQVTEYFLSDNKIANLSKGYKYYIITPAKTFCFRSASRALLKQNQLKKNNEKIQVVENAGLGFQVVTLWSDGQIRTTSEKTFKYSNKPFDGFRKKVYL